MSIEEFFSHELNEWSSSTDFYLADLAILQERLNEVADKNTKEPILASVEHFQNQFIVQKDNLQVIKHKINVQKDRLEAEVKKLASFADLDIVDMQHFLRESIHLNEKIFLELKHSFYRFLAKVF
jgi:hypothetical protein